MHVRLSVVSNINNINFAVFGNLGLFHSSNWDFSFRYCFKIVLKPWSWYQFDQWLKS